MSIEPDEKTPRAVFFDRDGVLNKSLIVDGKPHAPSGMAEFEIFPEARGLLERLKALGFLLFVVTNQPNVAKGTHKKDDVEEINRKLLDALPLDDILVCYHRDEDQCECRKPRPGFLLQSARKHSLDLKNCYMVGDRWRDVEAGQNAGCATVWIDCAYLEKQPQGHTFRCTSLTGAVEWILSRG